MATQYVLWGSALWGDGLWGPNLWETITQETVRRAGGGAPKRRQYLVRGRKYLLTDWELYALVQQLIAGDEPLQRAEVKVVVADKARVVPVQVWRAAIVPVLDEDDEEALLMLL